MKKLLFAGLFSLGCFTLTSCSSSDNKLIWSDEFDGKSAQPDPQKWTYEKGKVRNNEAQFYTFDRRENARVENGKLILEARKEKYENSEYTAASIVTAGKFSFQYGRIEIRAKVPHGRGVWPALWMLGENEGWPKCGEIDIMEYVGHNKGIVYCTVHGPKSATDPEKAHHFSSGRHLKDQTPWDDFHLYAVEWDAEKIVFFYDENIIHTYRKDSGDPAHWVFDRKMYLLMNIAIGGSWGGEKGIDDEVFPVQMEIDYVRVYQKK